MVDTDNAHRKRALKKLSKHRTDKLDNGKGRHVVFAFILLTAR
jgi:hypothetical protein